MEKQKLPWQFQGSFFNAIKLGLSDEDILRLTECTPDELQAARNLWLTQK